MTSAVHFPLVPHLSKLLWLCLASAYQAKMFFWPVYERSACLAVPSFISGDFREIVVQMIYISCYGVFGPNLVWIFWLNVSRFYASCSISDPNPQNLFEVCIDAAKVNTGLRSTASHYEFYHHFWVINHHFHVWLCAVTHGAGSGTVNMVSTIHRYFAQFVLDDVGAHALPFKHPFCSIKKYCHRYVFDDGMEVPPSSLSNLKPLLTHCSLGSTSLASVVFTSTSGRFPCANHCISSFVFNFSIKRVFNNRYTQIFCFMATNAAVFAAVKLLRSKGYSEKEKVM
jgi:hypothetical protein